MADIARDNDGIDTVDLEEEAPGGAGAAAEEGVVELRDEGEEPLPPGAALLADGTIALTLRQPVTLRFKRGTETRTESFERLVFHPLTGADMRVITAAKPEDMTPISIARSTRIHEGKMNALYDRMDGRDANAAQLCVLHFLGGGRRTGR